MHQALFAAARRVPVVALGDGIVMGAGAGLFMAAERGFRVATEATVFAMPEANNKHLESRFFVLSRYSER